MKATTIIQQLTPVICNTDEFTLHLKIFSCSLPLVSSKWLFRCGLQRRRGIGPPQGRQGLQTDFCSAGTVSWGKRTAALHTALQKRTYCSLQWHKRTQQERSVGYSMHSSYTSMFWACFYFGWTFKVALLPAMQKEPHMKTHLKNPRSPASAALQRQKNTCLF